LGSSVLYSGRIARHGLTI